MDEIDDALEIFSFNDYDCTNSTQLGWYCDEIAYQGKSFRV